MTKEKEALIKTMRDQAQRHFRISIATTELSAECNVELKEFNSVASLVAEYGLFDSVAVNKLFKVHCNCVCEHVNRPETYPGEQKLYWDGISQETEGTLTAEVKKGEIKCDHAKGKLQEARDRTREWREILADHKAGR